AEHDLGADSRTSPDGSPQEAALHESEQHRSEPAGRHPAPCDLALDPASGAVINRENDISRLDEPRPHPDQALLRLRAYRPASGESESPSETGPHANIEA